MLFALAPGALPTRLHTLIGPISSSIITYVLCPPSIIHLQELCCWGLKLFFPPEETMYKLWKKNTYPQPEMPIKPIIACSSRPGWNPSHSTPDACVAMTAAFLFLASYPNHTDHRTPPFPPPFQSELLPAFRRRCFLSFAVTACTHGSILAPAMSPGRHATGTLQHGLSDIPRAPLVRHCRRHAAHRRLPNLQLDNKLRSSLYAYTASTCFGHHTTGIASSTSVPNIDPSNITWKPL